KNEQTLLKKYSDCINKCYGTYLELIEGGVSREMARMVLPVAQYTQFYWTINARSLLNFISLRADSHAQPEIQEYAKAISRVFKEKMPWTWEAFSKV
ncbi:MAG: FAD-dependent thymidylate synthase, partial [Elusimicrobia bacterium]|nr:FAD-dependent thymidylate synthase [Elusimicrobiota bacterium]